MEKRAEDHHSVSIYPALSKRNKFVMRSHRSHNEDIASLLGMLEKGRFISRAQAAKLFGCSEKTVNSLIKELRENGHDIHYSRSLQKYILRNSEKK
ncbi:MAG: HTH domain-containing protein [Bacteroidota bacterium]